MNMHQMDVLILYVVGDSEKAFKELLKEFGIEVEDE